MSYVYVLNDPRSDTNIDLESTDGYCGGFFNGLYDVCHYYSNLVKGNYATFTNDGLGNPKLRVQAQGDTNPQGVYDLKTCAVMVNKATGTIEFSHWDGPNGAAAAAKGGKAKKAPTEKNKKQQPSR